MRKDWDHYFMDIAFKVAERSTCNRLKVGAVVIKNNRIKGTGYNGSPAGLPHCEEIGCEIKNNHCIRCIHAEVNALLECSPEEREGATLYVTDEPCAECQKLIITSGISKVIYARSYPPEKNWFALTDKINIKHLNNYAIRD